MEQYFACKCGFKCVENQLAKTEGACPKCGSRNENMKNKYGGIQEKTDLHKKSRGEI